MPYGEGIVYKLPIKDISVQREHSPHSGLWFWRAHVCGSGSHTITFSG